jgi:hypothetical protein
MVMEVGRVANVEGCAAGGACTRFGAALSSVQTGCNWPNSELPSGSTTSAGIEFFCNGSITHANLIRSKLFKLHLKISKTIFL